MSNETPAGGAVWKNPGIRDICPRGTENSPEKNAFHVIPLTEFFTAPIPPLRKFSPRRSPPPRCPLIETAEAPSPPLSWPPGSAHASKTLTRPVGRSPPSWPPGNAPRPGGPLSLEQGREKTGAPPLSRRQTPSAVKGCRSPPLPPRAREGDPRRRQSSPEAILPHPPGKAAAGNSGNFAPPRAAPSPPLSWPPGSAHTPDAPSHWNRGGKNPAPRLFPGGPGGKLPWRKRGADRPPSPHARGKATHAGGNPRRRRFSPEAILPHPPGKAAAGNSGNDEGREEVKRRKRHSIPARRAQPPPLMAARERAHPRCPLYWNRGGKNPAPRLFPGGPGGKLPWRKRGADRPPSPHARGKATHAGGNPRRRRFSPEAILPHPPGKAAAGNSGNDEGREEVKRRKRHPIPAPRPSGPAPGNRVPRRATGRDERLYFDGEGKNSGWLAAARAARASIIRPRPGEPPRGRIRNRSLRSRSCAARG